MNSNLTVCTELLNVLVGQGVRTVVISPGSRNTPLIQVASQMDQLRKVVIPDERTAAFSALGMGIVSRGPVALICTSGTALYNYAPAVAEAYYQKIPLIVITADRPAQWINQDDSQTLVQPGALANIVKRSYDIPVAHIEEPLVLTQCHVMNEEIWNVNRTANEAVITARSGHPGPVHINIQFDDPLSSSDSLPGLETRIMRVVRNESGLPPHQLRELALELSDKRVMVVAGFMGCDNELNKALVNFSKLPNVTVLAETISNLHLDGHPYMVDSMLSGLTEEERQMLRPDIVISIGGALISRKLKNFLRDYVNISHWTLGDTDVSIDCFKHLDVHIDIAPCQFFRGIYSMTKHLERKGIVSLQSDYRERCNELREKKFSENHKILAQTGWSELTALDRVFSTIPRNFNLFLSNGTCVRYAQILMDRLPHACYCNRGVSGIDGTNATAFGVSLEYKGPTVLVTGDMSFAYCPEVMHLRKLGGDLRIIVMNNAGGGIFRFIKTTRNLDIREKYFCADPGLPIDKLTEAYGWKYLMADDEKTLRSALHVLLNESATLLEVRADAGKSAEILLDFLHESQEPAPTPISWQALDGEGNMMGEETIIEI